MKAPIQKLGPTLALLLLAVPSQAQNIRVEVNGEPVTFHGVGPQQVQGRVLVPLRGVLEKLGAYVDWAPATQTVVASRGNLDLQLKIGSRTALVNGREVSLDVPATTIAGSTMVPLRFVGETLGAEVRWEGATSTVMITTRPADTVAEDDRSNSGRDRRGDRRTDRDDRSREREGDRDRERERTDNPPPRPAPTRPVIDRISHDRERGWLRAGDTLTIRLQGTPGSDASFRIPGVAENVKMREVSPGVYEQAWSVPANASLNLAEAPILGMLRAPGADERDTSVVQAARTIQVDSSAPVIADLNPTPRSEVAKRRPLISATFSDQGGSGIDINNVRVLVDGQNVTSDAAVTGQFFSYTPAQPLEGRNHRVEVSLTDRAGNPARQAWDFVSPDTPNVKGIEEIQTNAHGELKPGTVLNFAVRGIPGSRASWSMGTWKDIPLRETTPGRYVGSYRLRESDALDKAHLTVKLEAPGSKAYTESYTDPLTVIAVAPEAPKITYPATNDNLTDPLVIRGTAAPNSTVRLKLDYTEKVLGVLGVKGTAAQLEVPVGADGKWASQPIELGSLLRSRGTQLNLTATAVNARQQESPVTNLRIR